MARSNRLLSEPCEIWRAAVATTGTDALQNKSVWQKFAATTCRFDDLTGRWLEEASGQRGKELWNAFVAPLAGLRVGDVVRRQAGQAYRLALVNPVYDIAGRLRHYECQAVEFREVSELPPVTP